MGFVSLCHSSLWFTFMGQQNCQEVYRKAVPHLQMNVSFSIFNSPNHRQRRVHQQCGPSPSLPVGSGDWPLGLSSASVTHPVVASFYLMLDENPRSMRGHCWARLPADASGSETGCQ